MKTIISDDCKHAIVSWCAGNENQVCSLFIPALSHDQYLQTLDIASWKRMRKETINGEILRVFDCKPFDDQLRAYVLERNGSIVSVEVHGE